MGSPNANTSGFKDACLELGGVLAQMIRYGPAGNDEHFGRQFGECLFRFCVSFRYFLRQR